MPPDVADVYFTSYWFYRRFNILILIRVSVNVDSSMSGELITSFPVRRSASVWDIKNMYAQKKEIDVDSRFLMTVEESKILKVYNSKWKIDLPVETSPFRPNSSLFDVEI